MTLVLSHILESKPGQHPKWPFALADQELMERNRSSKVFGPMSGLDLQIINDFIAISNYNKRLQGKAEDYQISVYVNVNALGRLRKCEPSLLIPRSRFLINEAEATPAASGMTSCRNRRTNDSYERYTCYGELIRF